VIKLVEVKALKCDRKSLFGVLVSLDWIKILREAIEGRRSSWGERPVVEWRNAGDQVFSALIAELNRKKIDPFKAKVVEVKAVNKAPKVFCPKERKHVPIWYCLGSFIQAKKPCPYCIEATVEKGGKTAKVKCNWKESESP